MDKIESYLCAEKLTGNLYEVVNGNHYIRLEKHAQVLNRGSFIVSKKHVSVNVLERYSPYAWIVFSGFNFKTSKLFRNATSFRFEDE